MCPHWTPPPPLRFHDRTLLDLSHQTLPPPTLPWEGPLTLSDRFDANTASTANRTVWEWNANVPTDSRSPFEHSEDLGLCSPDEIGNSMTYMAEGSSAMDIRLSAPTSDGGTRLVNRIHAVDDWRHPLDASLGVVLMEFGDFAMNRWMMRGIKSRAESLVSERKV
jgi:hypothetical protein